MTYYDEHSHDEFLIIKVLANEANTEEDQEFQEKCNNNQSFLKLYSEMKDVWDNSEALLKTKDLDIDSAIKGFTHNIEKAEKKRKNNFIVWIGSVAAVIFIGVILLYPFFTSKPQEVITSDKTATIVLPDSSKIVVNKSSRLTYPKHFNKKYREVALTGEAYFEIRESKEQPFIIHSDKARIKVLGTSFNVKGSSDSVIVSVDRGKVLLSSGSNESKQVLLTQGETGIFSVKNEMILKQTNPDPNSSSWATGVFKFDQTNLSNAVILLEGYFHTNIILQDKALGNCKITASFNNQSLNAILEILELTFDIKVLKTDSIILIGKGCIKD